MMMMTMTEDLSGKYVAVLEERRQLSTQVSDAQRQLRTSTDKLVSVLANLASTSTHVARLQTELESLQRGSVALRRASADAAAEGAGSLVGPGRLRVGSVPDAVVGAGLQQTAKRSQENQANATAATGTRTSKRLKSTEIDVDVDVDLHAAAFFDRDTDIYNHLEITGTGINRIIECKYCLSQLSNGKRPRWFKHMEKCSNAPFDVRAAYSDEGAMVLLSDESPGMEEEPNDPENIDNHVTKIGSGLSRIVRCNYCQDSLKTDKKKKWIRHMQESCSVIPNAVRARFGVQMDEEPNQIPGQVSLVPVARPLPPPVSHMSAMNAPKVTSRRGSSAMIPEPVVQLIPAASTYPVVVVRRVPIAADLIPAAKWLLTPYPTPTPPYLPDGTKNTLGFRAWMDIVRYQMPGFKITNATGLKMTSFKKMYSYPEVRMVPETQTSKFSNGCFAIPESLHAAFMDHFNAEGKSVPLVAATARVFVGGVKGSMVGGWMGAKETAGAGSAVVRDGSHDSLSESGIAAVAKPAEDKNIIKSVDGTRYNAIIKQMMPEFPNLADDSRKAIKRGVRLFLEAEMGDRFNDCVITRGGGTMYMIPDNLLASFKVWAYDELTRCFPTMPVAKL